MIPLIFGWLIIPLFYVWWKRISTKLRIYEDGRIVLENGVLNKDYQEIMIDHGRSIRVQQSFVDRILNIGTLIISTAGRATDFDEELLIKGIERPKDTKKLILASRSF